MERMTESHFKRVHKFWERRFKRYRFSRLALTDLSSAIKIFFPWNLHRPVSGFRPPSAMKIRDLGPQLDDKRSINQVITLNIVSEEPDESRNTQQYVII
jgi:hypothetical protein